jgi:hypothetical protein
VEKFFSTRNFRSYQTDFREEPTKKEKTMGTLGVIKPGAIF